MVRWQEEFPPYCDKLSGFEESRRSASSRRTVSCSQSTVGFETFGGGLDTHGDVGVWGASARGVGAFMGVSLDGAVDGRSGDSTTLGLGGGWQKAEESLDRLGLVK
jgi:hypothetical protein